MIRRPPISTPTYTLFPYTTRFRSRRLIAALAARAGLRTIFANDGETAVAMLGTQDGMRLDAILLDHWIPDFDTSRLITDIRERRPGLPILILTAHNNVAVAVEAMRAGATDFLSKPIAPDRDRKSTRLNSSHYCASR